MKYAIEILEKSRKILERNIKKEHLMHKNINKATELMQQISQLKKAIKVLKQKDKNMTAQADFPN